MKKILIGGFFFVGGAIIMTIGSSGVIPIIGMTCAFLGGLRLLKSLLENDDSE